MSMRLTMGFIVTALSAGVGGWLIAAGHHDVATEPRQATATITGPTPSPPKSLDTRALILVSTDGNVTLRVEQQPLRWVLEEIARQSGWTELRPPSCTAVSQRPAVAAQPSAASEREAQGVTQAQATGALPPNPSSRETENLQAQLAETLRNAPDEGTALRALYQSDATDEMRLLAFETHLGTVSGDRAQLRQVLEAASRSRSAVVQAEAKRRLDELNDNERLNASTE